MGCFIRLVASLVRNGLLLVLAGMGGLGCSTCPLSGPQPLPDSPVPHSPSQAAVRTEPAQESVCATLTQTGYRAADAPAEKSLADTLAMPAPVVPPAGARPLQILAVSGGVAGAPFTAGLLVGWTKTGTRPLFDQVTGISSGSLVGAYACLGPKYDAAMQHLTLTANTASLIKFRPLYSMLCEGSFGTSKPAECLLRRSFDAAYMNDLRLAYAEGRRFYVGTMNLETRRLVVWDIGALASSGRPDADDLVRKVLLAAISWPGAVPPVVFDMEINGHHFHEEHCDAGAVAMVMPPFGLPPTCLANADVYVLASRKLYPEPACVPKRAFCRLKPCIMAFFEALTRENIIHLHSLCMLTGAHFHLFALPQDYHGEAPSMTNLYPKEAPRLFDTGYQMAIQGPHWRCTPPGAEPDEQVIPHDATGIQVCH